MKLTIDLKNNIKNRLNDTEGAKLKSTKGFTLAELLIVVAIIGVLVAISIPIFTSQLEKSRDAASVQTSDQHTLRPRQHTSLETLQSQDGMRASTICGLITIDLWDM